MALRGLLSVWLLAGGGLLELSYAGFTAVDEIDGSDEREAG